MKKSYLNSKKNSALLLQPSKAIYLLLMVLFFSLFGNTLIAQTQTFTNPGTTTWICPAGVTSINVEAWGAGAGGSLDSGGGGGAAFAGNNAVPVSPGATYEITVGTGGSVGVSGGNSSIALKSTPTVFLVKAEGGGKIASTIGGNAINCVGSLGLVWSGGNGIVGTFYGGGGGGGSAGAGGAGGNGSDSVNETGGAGGLGGAAGKGTAGAVGGKGGSKTSKDGFPGTTPGSGGGEKYYNKGANASSGSGANGQVIISWCPTTKTEASTTTWNVINGVGSWNNGYPTNIKDLVFIGNFNSSTNTLDTVVEGCSCKVNSGAAVVFTSGKTLKISNEIKILGPTGSLTFENNSSLVQINEPVTNNPNSGSIIYKRKTTSVLPSDYTYWSSPVVGQKLNISLSYASGMFYSYNDFAIPENWKPETATTEMVAGKGYIIRGAQTTIPPGFYDATFTGVPNNGTKTIAIGPTGTSNLLGNPYPSAIDANLFLAANSSFVEGTIYLWTHNTAIQLAGNITNGTAGSGAYAYTSDDYASYNSTGGVGTGTGNLVNGFAQAVNIPTGKIAAGQAFFTTSIATGQNAVFNNSMRVAGGLLGIDNSQFFKMTNTKAKTTNTIEKNRIWLNLTNSQGAFKQTLVGYITDATNEYDDRFDGESFDGNEFVDFYSLNQDRNLVIQGRALPFDENDEVPLGYRTTINGAFTINIDQTDGLLTNKAVFIEDKLTNTVTDLKSGNYTFNTVAGTFNDRFVLRYTDKTLGKTNFDTQANKVLVSNINKQIKINSFAETIDKVTIYDLLGRQIYQKDKVNSNELSIANLVSSRQTLVVKTVLQNGRIVTDKIIY